MAVEFLRIDDRIIHGQVVTRWAMEYPCDGLIAVNDKAASDPLLKTVLKAASQKKTFVFTLKEFEEKKDRIVQSDKKYFLITKNPIDMAKILVDMDIKINIDNVNVGPQSARENTININNNADITKEEAEAYERIHQKGYKVDFRLVPDAKSVLWTSVRNKFIK